MWNCFPGHSGADDFCRYSHGNRIRRDVAAYNAAGADDGAASYPRSIEKNGVGTHPHVIFYRDALAGRALRPDRHIRTIEIMVLRMKAYVLAHNYVFADRDKTGAANKRISIDC